MAHIEEKGDCAGVDAELASGAALMGEGQHTARLSGEALEVARAVAPIDGDPTGRCAPFEVVQPSTGCARRAAPRRTPGAPLGIAAERLFPPSTERAA